MKLTAGNITVEAGTEAEARAVLVAAQIQQLYLFGENGLAIPPSIEELRAWAIAEVSRQAEAQQEATINLRGLYQQTEYLRWLIAGQPAQVSAVEYPLSAGDVVVLARFGDESRVDATWLSETIATEKSTTSLLEQAKSEAEVRSILSGLVWPSVR